MQNKEIAYDDEIDHYNLLRKLEIPRIEIDNPEIGEKKVIKKTSSCEEINNTCENATTHLDEPKSKIIINETVEIYEHGGFVF